MYAFLLFRLYYIIVFFACIYTTVKKTYYTNNVGIHLLITLLSYHLPNQLLRILSMTKQINK